MKLVVIRKLVAFDGKNVMLAKYTLCIIMNLYYVENFRLFTRFLFGSLINLRQWSVVKRGDAVLDLNM